ncbi:Lethal(2) giant larvae sro7 [Coemansia sp. RSA 455]|nr:Lethal(2) giant larvae sro7 [Coemansia sp. RSA 455]
MDAVISAAPVLGVGRLVDPGGGATAVGSDPTQGVLAVGYDSGRIDLYSPKHPTCARLHIGTPGAIAHLKLVPGQPSLAAIDSHGVLRVFDTDTLQLCFSYNVPSPPTCMSLLPGTRWLLIGTEMGRVYFVNSGEGLKSDFSIGSQVQPPSRVVSVESHPVETEKVLIAYAEGTCVVCDLGKSSLSEKHMVVSKHRYEHPDALKQSMRSDPTSDERFGASAQYVDLVEPRLTGASWSPSGDQMATAYTNGVFCIFGAGPEPIVARTIVSEDACRLSAADLERNTRCLKYVRWCTHASSDQSFLAITSGPAASYQQIVHVFGTGSQGSMIKSSSDIVACERYSLDASIGSLVTIPRLSPWRNECEGVGGLVVLVGKPAVVQMLELGPKLRLMPVAEQLPGELVWSTAPATLVRLAQGDLDPALRSQLAPIHQSHLHQYAAVPDRFAAGPDHDDMQLFGSIDSKDTLSLWCIYKGLLRPCVGVEFDVRYASWILGIEGHVSALDICAHSGLVVLGMNSGEALISVLHNGAHPLPLARHCVPSSELREQAAEYYLDDPGTSELSVGADEASDAALAAQGFEEHPGKIGTGLEPATLGDLPPSAPLGGLAATQRSRAVSVSERGFIRRSSKRLSSSIGTLFRRGARPRSTGGSFARPSSGRIQDHEDTLEAGMLGLGVSTVDRSSGSGLTRPMPIDHEAWRSQQTAVSTELSQMLYGLQLDAAEQHRMGGASSRTKPVSRPRIDSGAPALVDNGKVRPQRPGMSPLMLARFFRRKVVNVAAGQDGIIALVYAGGVLVVIDSPRQRVLLADNINQAPSSGHTARDVFFGTGTASQTTEWPEKGAAITAVSVVRLGRDIVHGSLGDTGFGNQVSLLIGTSQGCVLAYAIADMVAPPVVVERSRTGAILYMGAYPCRPGHGEMSDCAQALVVGSQRAVTVHSAKTLEPIASYVLPTRASSFVAVRLVELSSGWRGVVAVDSQANVALLALPRLERVQAVAIPEASGLISSAVVQISDHGLIMLLGPGGVLLQAKVTDSMSDGLSQQSMFDVNVRVPPLPVRKGITSWLLGKSSNASQDIDAFLGSHCRDLLAKGGIKPGMRLHKGLAPKTSRSARSTDMATETDRAVDEVGKAVDLEGVSESKNMLDKRGQQLEMIDERMQQASMQARGFLDDIRAYNAKQESSSKKRFGLF